MVIKSDGNVGIGTTGPNYPLDVQANTAASILHVQRTGASPANVWISGNNQWATFGSDVSYNFLRNSTNGIDGTSALFIQTTSGNVGIGTTTVNSRLVIQGSGATSATKNLSLFNSAGTEMVTVLNNGNVGIGTTGPADKLSIYGGDSSVNIGGNYGSGYNGIWLSGGTATSNYHLLAANGDNNLYINRPTGGDILFREGGVGPGGQVVIKTNGNVGIGTTSPAAKLDVAGSVKFSSLGNDATGYYVCLNTTTGIMSTSTTACGASSIRFKENVSPLNYGLAEIEKLQPVSFNWKKDFIPNNSQKQVGFIAEDVAKVIPEVVGYDVQGQVVNVDYAKIVPVAVNAIQEISIKVGSLASSTDSLKIETDTQTDQIADLQKETLDLQNAMKDLASSTAQSILQNTASVEIIAQINDIQMDINATTTEIAGKPTLFGRLLSSFKEWGVEIQSGFTRIAKLFVGEVHIEGNVCVDEICVTKNQFKEMILKNGGESSQNVGAVIESATTTSAVGSATTTANISNEATTTSAETGSQSAGNFGSGATTTESISLPLPSQGEGVGGGVEVGTISAGNDTATSGNIGGGTAQIPEPQVDNSQVLTP